MLTTPHSIYFFWRGREIWHHQSLFQIHNKDDCRSHDSKIRWKRKIKLNRRDENALLTGTLTWLPTSEQDSDIPEQKHGIHPKGLIA